MATPHLQRLKPGQQPTAAEWNALVELASRSGLATGTAFGDIGVSQGVGGLQVLDGREKGHWAKIGARGTGAAYAHTQAASDGDGTFTDLPAASEYEYGTTTSAPAREVNGNEAVEEDTYVWVWPDPVGDSPGYLFEFAGAGGTPRSDLVHNNAVGVSLTADGAWVDTGYQLTIPGAGLWQVAASLPAFGEVTALAAAGQVFGRVYDSTNSVVVDGAEWVSLAVQATSLIVHGSGGITTLYETTGATLVKLQAERTGGATWTFCNAGDGAAENLLSYLEIL